VGCDSVDEAPDDVNLKVAKVIRLQLVPTSIIFSTARLDAKPLAKIFKCLLSVRAQRDSTYLKLRYRKAGVGVGAAASADGPLSDDCWRDGELPEH